MDEVPEFDPLGYKLLERILEKHPHLKDEAKDLDGMVPCGCGYCVANALDSNHPELHLEEEFMSWRLSQKIITDGG